MTSFIKDSWFTLPGGGFCAKTTRICLFCLFLKQESAEVLARHVIVSSVSQSQDTFPRRLAPNPDTWRIRLTSAAQAFLFFFFAAKHFSGPSEAVSHDMTQVCRRPCLITGVCVLEDGGGGVGEVCVCGRGGDRVLAAAQNTCESWHAAPLLNLANTPHPMPPPSHPPTHHPIPHGWNPLNDHMGQRGHVQLAERVDIALTALLHFAVLK